MPAGDGAPTRETHDSEAVEVWSADAAAASPRLVRVLDPFERHRLARLRRPQDQSLFLAAHALTRCVLADRVGVSAERLHISRRCACGDQSHGKPFLPRTEVGFSVSHSGRRVVLAVSDGCAVGVDLEQAPLQGDLKPLAAAALSAGEHAAWQGIDPAAQGQALLVCWTRKEAVLKATGQGLSRPLHEIVVASADAAPEVLAGPDPARLLDLDLGPGYTGALCALTARDLALVKHDGGARLAWEGAVVAPG